MSGGPTNHMEPTLARRFCDGPGPHPGHPTVVEGCRTASRGYPLSLMTWLKSYRPGGNLVNRLGVGGLPGSSRLLMSNHRDNGFWIRARHVAAAPLRQEATGERERDGLFLRLVRLSRLRWPLPFAPGPDTAIVVLNLTLRRVSLHISTSACGRPLVACGGSERVPSFLPI